jgi:hypothetical protein
VLDTALPSRSHVAIGIRFKKGVRVGAGSQVPSLDERAPAREIPGAQIRYPVTFNGSDGYTRESPRRSSGEREHLEATASSRGYGFL